MTLLAWPYAPEAPSCSADSTLTQPIVPVETQPNSKCIITDSVLTPTNDDVALQVAFVLWRSSQLESHKTHGTTLVNLVTRKNANSR